MDAAAVRDIRLSHRPVSTCSCGKWECVYCGTVWPCQVERDVRSAGWRPIGIDEYGNPFSTLV